MKTFNYLILIFCAFIALSCEGWVPETEVPVPEWSSKRPMYPGETDYGGSGGGETPDPLPQWTGSEGTWYQIFTISYYDSNNDGKGDLQGIKSRLDYLNDTGTTSHNNNITQYGECNASLHLAGIWLTPIMQARSYHKYDTTDYLVVDSDFGTINDFTELLEDCHDRGIKVILDLAVNHTSPYHPWFLQALEEWETGKLGRYSTYYNFRTDGNGSLSNSEKYQKFGISNHWYRPYQLNNAEKTWPVVKTPDPGGKYVYYYGAFNEWMPDLNWDSTALKQEFEGILKFWLADVGIDGFRLDATKHIYETGEWAGDTNKNVAYWTWFAETVRKYKPDAFMVGENLSGLDDILEYHKPGMSSFFTGAHDRVSQAVNNGRGTYFSDGVLWWTREVKNRHPLATATPFLSNHDEDRSSQWLTMDEHRKMAASLLLLFPGMPFIYYGEEIGLKGWKEGTPADDKWVRGPMIFNWGVNNETVGRPNAPPDNWSLNNPNGHGRPAWVERGGVYQQLAEPASLLRHYIKINNWKAKYPWIAWGVTSNQGIDVDGDGQVGAYRVTDNNPLSPTIGKSVVIAHNTARNPRGGEAPDGYIKISGSQVDVLEAVSALGDPAPYRYDSNLGAYWIKPFSTVIFSEGN